MKRVLFIGGRGHFYLGRSIQAGLAEKVGYAGDGYDNAAAKEKAGDGPFFEDYREAIDELKPDVVNVGAVYGHAGEINVECLRRGLKVLSDKPVAATWEQLHAIEQVIDDDSILLTEFDFRSRPSFRAARQAVLDGLIGEPVLVTAQKSYRWGNRPDFYKNREDYGGTLLWIASHGIDAVAYVAGQPMTRVSGHHGNVAKPDYRTMEDHVAVVYELANGGSALVHADLLRPGAAPSHGDDRLRLVGSRGQLEVVDHRCTLITNDAEPTDVTALGREADIGRDLIAAIEGEMTHFSTKQSLEMARLLLVSRDACDQNQWLDVT